MQQVDNLTVTVIAYPMGSDKVDIRGAIKMHFLS